MNIFESSHSKIHSHKGISNEHILMTSYRSAFMPFNARKHTHYYRRTMHILNVNKLLGQNLSGFVIAMQNITI